MLFIEKIKLVLNWYKREKEYKKTSTNPNKKLQEQLVQAIYEHLKYLGANSVEENEIQFSADTIIFHYNFHKKYIEVGRFDPTKIHSDVVSISKDFGKAQHKLKSLPKIMNKKLHLIHENFLPLRTLLNRPSELEEIKEKIDYWSYNLPRMSHYFFKEIKYEDVNLGCEIEPIAIVEGSMKILSDNLYLIKTNKFPIKLTKENKNIRPFLKNVFNAFGCKAGVISSYNTWARIVQKNFEDTQTKYLST